MMMRNAGVAAAIMLGMSVGCAKTESKTDTTNVGAATPAAATTTLVGETDGLKTPESMRYDPELDVYYVSNIDGNPARHDNNGFISIVRADSTAAAPKILVAGGKNGVTLDAPKGLALTGDTLWVADIDHVRAFNRRTGAKLADFDLSPQKALFLNDVAVGGDGAVYVTDTGIQFDDKGGMSHPGTDQIFKISGGKATSITADSLDSPNGIAYDKANNRFILGSSGGKAVQSWKPGDKVPATLATGPGQYDGVEVLNDGRILITSWADSTLDVVQNGALTKLVTGLNGPADLGVDTKRMLVAVPLFNEGKVVYYKIP